MTRTDFINTYIKERGYTRYLEISWGNDLWNFSKINCTHRQIISADTPSNTAESAFDSFVLTNREQFDIILIDGIHTEDQVLKDIANSEKCLAKGGVIVLHDCLPPDEWHQRNLAAYKIGEAWNGTVWKAVLRTFNQSRHKCTIIDADWGCGVIDTSLSQIPQERKLPINLDYHHHYSLLMDYKISVASFLRERTQVFYHLACMGNWYQVYQEQMETLSRSGFRHINLTALGTENEIATVDKINKDLDISANLIYCDPSLSHFEKPAMIAIQAHAQRHHGYVLYLHSKGVSNPSDTTKSKWRALMMYELVEKWERSLVQLIYHDIVGVNWRDLYPVAHFCGNFWYATTQYLRTLADFENYYEHPRYQIWDAVHSKRLGCEFWIGSGTKHPKIHSLAYRNVDFCNPLFWRDK